MIRNHRYSFRATLLLAADNDNAGGSSGGGKEKATLLERVTSAEADRDKARTDLAAAQSQIADLTKERDDATAQSGRIQAQFDELSSTATKAQTDLKETQDKLATVSAEKATVSGLLVAAESNVSRLETLCGVKGIDPKAVPAVVDASVTTGLSEAQWEAKMIAAKTPAERSQVKKDFEAAAKAGQVSGR